MPKVNCQQRHAQWVERLERFADANGSVAEFCRREKVSVASFYAWKKRLSPATVAKTRRGKSVATETKFLPLVVRTSTTQPMATSQPSAAGQPNTAGQPVLRLPGGAAIELPSQLGRWQWVDLIAAVVEVTQPSPSNAEEAR